MYEKGIIIGRGGNAKITLFKTNNKEYACKIMKRSTDAYREVAITRYLQGTNGVIQLVSSDEDDRNLYMVLEKCRPLPKQPSNIPQHIRSVLQTISRIHIQGIIHHDIKPQNIMIADDSSLKIIDFGCSFYTHEHDKTFNKTTPLYCSVESLSSNITIKSDVWSVGVMTYYYLTGKYPFDGSSMHSVFRSIIREKPDMSLIDDVVAQDFVSQLLEKDPDKRPTALEALQHFYITGNEIVL